MKMQGKSNTSDTQKNSDSDDTRENETKSDKLENESALSDEATSVDEKESEVKTENIGITPNKISDIKDTESKTIVGETNGNDPTTPVDFSLNKPKGQNVKTCNGGYVDNDATLTSVATSTYTNHRILSKDSSSQDFYNSSPENKKISNGYYEHYKSRTDYNASWNGVTPVPSISPTSHSPTGVHYGQVVHAMSSSHSPQSEIPVANNSFADSQRLHQDIRNSEQLMTLSSSNRTNSVRPELTPLTGSETGGTPDQFGDPAYPFHSSQMGYGIGLDRPPHNIMYQNGHMSMQNQGQYDICDSGNHSTSAESSPTRALPFDERRTSSIAALRAKAKEHEVMMRLPHQYGQNSISAHHRQTPSASSAVAVAAATYMNSSVSQYYNQHMHSPPAHSRLPSTHDGMIPQLPSLHHYPGNDLSAARFGSHPLPI